MTEPVERWVGPSTFTPGSEQQNRADSFYKLVDWKKLHDYVSGRHGGCDFEPGYAVGGRHMVRKLNFIDTNSAWIIRLPMPHPGISTIDAGVQLTNEFDCYQLVRDRTDVPVPKVFEIVTDQSPVKSPFLLMEYLPGRVAMDIHFDFIPSQFKEGFFKQMAEIQVKISSITSPKIGSVIHNADGSYDAGPIPGLGGPYKNAYEYLDAWTKNVKFPLSKDRILAASGEHSDEVTQSIENFPSMLKEHYLQSPTTNNDQYHLWHPDFGHNNIIVDANYNILGVIDWEGAYFIPDVYLDFPLTVSTIPRAMDIPTKYDSAGVHLDPAVQARVADRELYLKYVREAEEDLGLSSTLSRNLEQPSQDIARAMRLFSVDGKVGFYSRLFKELSSI